MRSPGVLAGLAQTTQKENQKADKFEEQYQRVKGSAEVSQIAKQASPTGSSMGFEDPGSQGLGFEEDLKHFEGLLEELGKSIRMERLLEVAAQADQKEEEARRQRERERKARDAARERQAASNPSRRIALRLDRCREAGMAEQVEITTHNNIPLKKHLVLSGHSPERLEIVNVPILQKRCLGLAGDGSSTSFKALQKCAELEERRQQWDATAVSQQSPRDFVRANLLSDSVRSRTWDCVSEKRSQQEQRAKARHLEAALRRDKVEGDRHLCKINSKGPARCASEAFAVQRCDSSPKSVQKAKTTSQLFGTKQRTMSAKRLQDTASSMDPKRARRGLFWWRVLRGVLGAFWLLRLVRTRHWATDVARTVLQAVGQIGAIRIASRRVRLSVIKLQRALRAFLLRKRRWCDATAKVWAQYEDQYLQSFFRVNQRSDDGSGLALSDKRSAVRRGRRSTLMMDSGLIDWRIFRVPAAQRRFTLGRWYIVQVRQWVEKREFFVSIVRRAMQQQADVANYMRLCGIDPKTVERAPVSAARVPPVAELPQLPLDSCTSLGESEALELIRLAASELVNTVPFSEHPANRTNSAKPYTRISAHLRRILQKRSSMPTSTSMQQKVDASPKRFSIDTMEHADYGEAVGDRRSSKGVAADGNILMYAS